MENKPDETSAIPVEIPFSELSAVALRGVIESFVLREGTDYGDEEYSLDDKVNAVLAQLKRGQAVIMYDPKDQTCDVKLVNR